MKTQTRYWIVAGALALLSMTLPSCKKGCYKCTGGNTNLIICRDDYGSQKEFEAALDYAKAFGSTCKK